MMEKELRKKIRKSIFRMLKEETEDASAPAEDPSPTPERPKTSNKGVMSTKGAFGSGGRSKKFVAETGARAKKDPEGLMKDLGTTSAVSGDDLGQALKILNRAIHTHPAMSEAYVGAKNSTDIPKGSDEKLPVVAIKMGKLDRKNGLRFLAHTLTAAQNAGFLNLRGGLQFAIGQVSPIVIYSN